jgi:hypothetical protein
MADEKKKTGLMATLADLAIPEFTIPEPRAFRIPPMKVAVFADTTFARISEAIAAFQNDLNADEEVAACVAHFGHSLTIQIESIGYRNPYLITFTGTDDQGRRVQLVQHMSQVNLLLVAVPAKETPARRIGFQEPEPTPIDDEEKAP